MPKFDTVAGPAHWASYLVNGDASGLEPHDRAMCDAWQASLDLRIVGIVDAEPWFTWAAKVYCPQLDTNGCAMLEYVCEKRNMQYDDTH